MIQQQHPIAPPPELREQWECEWREHKESETVIGWSIDLLTYVTDRSAQWGADQELEACIAWMTRAGYWAPDGIAAPALRDARRPKPKSLKEQGIKSLDNVINCIKSLVPGASVDGEDIKVLRRALESIPDPS